jgi:predicted amidohydrolase YtcJ
VSFRQDADLALWDRDPYRIPADDLRNLKCELTMMAGRIVYQAAGGAVTVR